MHSERAQRFFFPLLLVLVFLLIYVPWELARPSLGSDETAYFSHASTLALDFDLDYSNELAAANGLGPTGMPVGAAGAGVLGAPFVWLFGLIDRIIGHPILKDHTYFQYSWSHFGMALAPVVYFWIGLWLYWKTLQQIFQDIRFELVFLLAISTGILYYVLIRPVVTHGYEFFTLALVVWGSTRYYTSLRTSGKRGVIWGLVVGLGAALSVAVRPNNINAFILPFFVIMLLYLLDTDSGRPVELRLPKLFVRLIPLLGCMLVMYVPLAVFNEVAYNEVVASAMQVYGDTQNSVGGIETITNTDWWQRVLVSIPGIFRVIFGAEFGVLYSNPLIIFGPAYLLLYLGRKINRRLVTVLTTALLVGAYCLPSVLIALTWKGTGNAYGYRFLFPLIPIGLIGTGMLLRAYYQEEGGASYLTGLIILIALLCVFSILGTALFGVTDGLTPGAGVNAFGEAQSSTARWYEVELLKALVSPRAWLNLPAKRYVGLLAAPIISQSFLASNPQLAEMLTRYSEIYGRMPSYVYVQTLIIFAIWMGFGLLFYKASSRRGATSG